MKKLITMLILMTTMLAGCCTEKPLSSNKGSVVAEKPVLYLYGYNNKNVSIKLDVDGEITSTYPAYDEGWYVTAKQDGTLESVNKKDSYPYLYWEGKLNDVTFDFNKGFCIKGTDTGTKLNEILKNIGLNDKERADFITYWLPSMEKNEYNIVSFQTKAYTEKAKLDISPKPKSITRVFMAWYGTDDFVKMDEQKFTKCPREGMYAIEWGGCEVNSDSFMPLYSAETEESTTANELVSEYEKINKYMELTIEENNAKQQSYLNEIRYLQSAAYYKMLGMTSAPSSVPSNLALSQKAGHAYTDPQGNKTTFTDEEWKRLQNVWAWTGHADDMIKKHSVSELNQLLGK